MLLLNVDAGSFLNDKSETEADIKTKEKTIKDLDDLIKGAEEVLASTDDKRIQELNKDVIIFSSIRLILVYIELVLFDKSCIFFISVNIEMIVMVI